MNVLHVTVAEPVAASLQRAQTVMTALERGERVAPWHGVGFEDMPQMLAALTPRRWALIAELRAAGPVSIAELARRTGRNYKNVHADVMALIEWHIAERDDDARVSVPWSAIVVDLKLPDQVAA
jgi:predicted transcriptional regulator